MLAKTEFNTIPVGVLDSAKISIRQIFVWLINYNAPRTSHRYKQINTYDGLRNLVVQMSSDAGTATHGYTIVDDPRFDSRTAFNLDRTQASGTLADRRPNIRFWIDD